jgi:hypothetical protein
VHVQKKQFLLSSIMSNDAGIIHPVGLEVLMTIVMKNSVFWDITPYSPLKVNRHFGGMCILHLKRRICQASFLQEHCSACYLLHAGFLLGLFFNPEDGGDMFL